MRIMRNMTGKKQQLVLYHIRLMRHIEVLFMVNDGGRPNFNVTVCRRQFQCDCFQGRLQIFLPGVYIACNYRFRLICVIVYSCHLSGVSIMRVMSYGRECVSIYTSHTE